MDDGNLVTQYTAVRKLNSAIYHYRSHRWRFDPRFRLGTSTIPIDRPIFLIGTQGGGLTLTSRILRRNPRVVSVTGSADYWSGADEMQNVLQDALPEELSWYDVRAWGRTGKEHNWLYASDTLYPYYHSDADDASAELGEKFRKLVRGLLHMNRPSVGDVPGRLVDKSQSYTVRVGLINRLLAGCDPKFLLLVRNPFAMCWRAVTRDAIVSSLPLDEPGKLSVAIQHWRNSMNSALECQSEADLQWWRFEDVLEAPKRTMNEICDFLELRFDKEMLPSSSDRIPWGSGYDAFTGRKWYPLRTDVNARYLQAIPAWAAERVWRECHELIERFNYSRPRVQR